MLDMLKKHKIEEHAGIQIPIYYYEDENQSSDNWEISIHSTYRWYGQK